jgi:hypothetical protein
MSASNFNRKPTVPGTVANLDLAQVVEALARHAGNVTDAAADLVAPPSDLRRLLWANPKLQDLAFEVVEARIDKAEKNVHEALHSDDPRMRVAASIFTLRNSAKAKTQRLDHQLRRRGGHYQLSTPAERNNFQLA